MANLHLPPSGATIRIDGKTYQADPSKNLLDVCLSLGLELPYFCWHPALGSVGACRQCAVKQFKDDEDERGRLVMACMTPASDGTLISIDDAEARELRASVIEWLMANHPHDCPVCDEGGECHLQDMTVKTGHNYRRCRFKKRTHRNQDLGPLVNHEMNRCIACYRCVRFYGDYAGGDDLKAFGAHDHVYFGRHEDGPLENEFSGNLVEICPTGVFTDKTLKSHYTRKWDLLTAPSVCVHCGLGCNTTPGERYGELRRVRARYHGKVNGYFLCDRGRYGYEFAGSERRIRRPLLPRGPDEGAEAIDRDEAIARFADLIRDPERVIGVGSPRASLETNFALKTLVGPEHFFQGVSEVEGLLTGWIVEILRQGSARIPTLREVEECDAALVLGEDVTNTAPMLALALRRSARRQPEKIADELRIPGWHDAAVRDAVQQDKGPLYVASPASTRLDDAARRTWRGAPEDVARLGFQVAHELDPEAPAVSDLAPESRRLAAEIARDLAAARRPLVVSGTGCGSAAVIQAAANVAWALGRKRQVAPEGDRRNEVAPKGDRRNEVAPEGDRRNEAADLFYTVAECNSIGLELLGGGSLEEAFEAIEDGDADTVVIVENDLYRRAAAETVDRFLSKARHVVVIDHLAHGTGARAELVLPAATFAKANGTLVSNEGRAQRFYRVFPAPDDVRRSWRWLCDDSLDDLVLALSESDEMFQELPAVSPPVKVPPEGDKWKVPPEGDKWKVPPEGDKRKVPPEGDKWNFRRVGAKLPRALHRYSGRTSMRANISVHEPKPHEDSDSPLSFSMEGYEGQPPGALASAFWAPGWNSIQSLNRFQEEIAGPLKEGDPGVCLFTPSADVVPADAEPAYFAEVPAPFVRRKGQWRVVALYHIFGSEELSYHSPGVAQLAPEPYVALNPEDADELGLNGMAELSLDGRRVELPLRLRPELPRGLVALPQGLPELIVPRPPAWTEVRKGPSE